MKEEIVATIHYIDGTNLKIKFKWNEKENEPATMITKVRKALEMDRFYFEVDGNLIIIPTQNIKYLSLTQLPAVLPKDLVIRDAAFVDAS